VSRYAPITLLGGDHDTSSFDCGSEQQTNWLRRYALTAQQARTARVYVSCRANGLKVAGYYALSAGQVLPPDATPRLAKGTSRHPIPIIVLGRLGLDVGEQGHGLGSALVRDALLRVVTAASTIGVRALLIHAETTRAAAFYRRLDPAFEPSPTDPLDLVLLVKDIEASIQRAAIQRMTAE
jgi:hypothetical protein